MKDSQLLVGIEGYIIQVHVQISLFTHPVKQDLKYLFALLVSTAHLSSSLFFVHSFHEYFSTILANSG